MELSRVSLPLHCWVQALSPDQAWLKQTVGLQVQTPGTVVGFLVATRSSETPGNKRASSNPPLLSSNSQIEFLPLFLPHYNFPDSVYI